MDAVEYIKTVNRLCKNRRFYKEGTCTVGFGDYSVEHIEETISKVEQWAKEHPVKTRQSEFLKRFPNAKLDSNGVLAIRPCDIDSKYCTDDDYLSKCGTCAKDYWLTEVPDND